MAQSYVSFYVLHVHMNAQWDNKDEYEKPLLTLRALEFL